MDLELKGKVAVVTGGSKGIGLAVVRTLAAEGARVVAGALTVDTLRGIDGVTPVEVDLVEPSGSERLVGEAVERHGRVDVLLNNVGGVKVRLDGFLSISDADFERSLQLNFFAALRATRAAVAEMLKQGEGAIVNVASVNAFFHPDGPGDRLRRSQSRAAQPRQGALTRARAEGHPYQQRLAWTGCNRPLAR
jgi:NAD(P)-dependent dehydrogenase (short-subunit alcohol dehydrogenase family)